MKKTGNYRGPEHDKLCAMADGPPTREFRLFWRHYRRMFRAPKVKDF